MRLTTSPNIWGSCRSFSRWPAGGWDGTGAEILSRGRWLFSCCFPLVTTPPVFALARLLLPPLGLVRYPMKLLVHIMLLVGILAGWGFDALRSTVFPWKAQGKRLAASRLAGRTLIVLAAAWVLPGLITTPTRWLLHTLSEFPMDVRPMPDVLLTHAAFSLPGLTGFCLAARAVVGVGSRQMVGASRAVYPGATGHGPTGPGELRRQPYRTKDLLHLSPPGACPI